MWWFLPVLSVALPSDLHPELKPETSDYMISFGVFVIFAIAPHWVAGKILAGEKANILKGVLAAVLQILLSFLLWAVLLWVFVFCGASVSAALWLSGAATAVLLGLLMAGIYGFGIAKGIAYNLSTTLAMFCILRLLVIFIDPLPLKKVSIALAERAAAHGINRMEEVAKTQHPQTVPKETGAVFASAAEAQKAAVKKYPDLGVAGSPFNRRFLEIHNLMKNQQSGRLLTTNWPMEIADIVATESRTR